ncbi:phosphatase PAP2 family protein [Nocardiopsis coralliicola]
MDAEIPSVSSQWSRSAIEFGEGLDPWVRSTLSLASDGILLVFALLFAAALWRAWGRGPRAMALALCGPAAVVVAYAVSKTTKDAIGQYRPCQVMTELSTIAPCDPLGDWSFPSNHAAIAGAAAVALIVAWRRLAAAAVLLALLEAGSRVLLGAHFPHDVAAGLLLGAAVAALALAIAAVPATAVVSRIPVLARERGTEAGPGAMPQAAEPHPGAAASAPRTAASEPAAAADASAADGASGQEPSDAVSTYASSER